MVANWTTSGYFRMKSAQSEANGQLIKVFHLPFVNDIAWKLISVLLVHLQIYIACYKISLEYFTCQTKVIVGNAYLQMSQTDMLYN